MFENELHEHKEQSGAGWRLAFLLLLGAVIILGGGLLVAWQVSTHQVPHVASSSAGTTTAKGSSFPTAPVPLPATYKEIVKQQVAQGLHLSVTQVQTKLQSEIDLFYVATDQHITGIPDSVITLEINASQAASKKMVDTGVWTQHQADQNMQFWRQLDHKAITQEISQWFRGQ